MNLPWAIFNAGLFIGSGTVFCLALKRVFFAGWRGSPAVVAVVLIGLGWALALGQLLGAVGWLRPGPLLASAVGSAALAVAARRRCPIPEVSPAADTEGAEPTQPALLIATVVLVLFVAAVWTARTVIAVRRGIYDPDSLGYHLPFTAIFAQTGYADPTGFRFPSAPIHFFPANDELLSAIALVLTKSVVYAAIKNLLLGGVLLVAAHAIGKAFGAGLPAVSAAAIVLGLPAVAFSQAGEAMNDTLPLLALVGGLAVLAHARDRPAPYVLALACTGMAYGSKYSAVIPAVALGVLVLALLRSRVSTSRRRTAGFGVFASLALGGSWYLRDAVVFGSPLPPARVAVGPFHLRQIVTEGARDSYSVAWYLVRGRALRQFWDGLTLGLSPLFLLVIAAVVFGAVAGLRSSSGFQRGLSVLAVVTGIGYLTLPGSAYGGDGMPGPGFVINLHYAMPVLVISAVGAAIAAGARRWSWVVPVAGLVVVATSIRPGQRVRVWAPEMGGRGFAVLIAAGLAAGVATWMSTRRAHGRWVVASAASVVLAVVGVTVIARQSPSLSETDAVQVWAARASPTSIGGWAPPQALLFGPGARNRVITLTRDRSVDGGPVVLDSCPAWMQALIDGRFPFTSVVTGSVWQRWLDADPAFELVARSDKSLFYPLSVYRVGGRPDVGCPRTS